ncbi:SPOSA6832_03888, partial [Sporobolomyces salmonicolor]
MSSSVSSLATPVHKLNSSSPASELPTTSMSSNDELMTLLDFADFNDPPEPPSDLRSSDFVTSTGQFRAPFPVNEAKRQRSVDATALLNQGQARRRRASLKSSKDTTSSPNLSDSTEPPSYDDGGETRREVLLEVTKEDLATFKPKELPTHEALQKLAKEAQERFGVDATTVSLMDRDQQLMLAQQGHLINADTVERQYTCCSHTLLKASTGARDPLVNGFGDYTKGFYAAAPIMLAGSLGDEAVYPGGVFCLLGKAPRISFDEKDRADLAEMAGQASAEIQRCSKAHRKAQRVELGVKRREWKTSKHVSRSLAPSELDIVVEMPSPPLTPTMSSLDLSDDEPVPTAEVDGQEYPRRPSLADSAASDKSIDLKATSIAPAFVKRRGREGVQALPPKPLPPDIQSVIDLSTKLVTESIEMDFAYVVAVDLSASSASTSSETSPIRLVSIHGMPIPPPLFSVDLHLETLRAPHSALLYVDEKPSGQDGEFSTGLLVRIGTVDQTGYVLGTFSEDARRVLNKEDLLFVRSFGRDLSKSLLAV